MVVSWLRAAIVAEAAWACVALHQGRDKDGVRVTTWSVSARHRTPRA
jgi:hypothetical protein